MFLLTAGGDLTPDTLAEKVKEKLAVMLMMPADDIDPAQPMINYGVDSLTSIDIAAWMMKEFQVSQASSILLRVSSSSCSGCRVYGPEVSDTYRGATAHRH